MPGKGVCKKAMLGQSLIEAVECGDAAGVESLLAAGADANTSVNTGETVLMRAAAKGNPAVVEALLRGAPEIESKLDDGMTALMLASFFGHTGVVAVLLRHRADVSAQDKTTMTALNWAQARGHLEVCALLKGAAVGNRPVPLENFPQGVGSVPGVEEEPQAAVGTPETTRAESWREEMVQAETIIASSYPPPPTEPAAADALKHRDRRGRKAAPRHDVLIGEGVFDASASTRVNRLRYYAGATCIIVSFLTGLLYSFTEGSKNVPAVQPAGLVQPRTLPAVQTRPAGPQPESAQSLPARTPTRSPAVRTSEGRSANLTGDIVETRQPPRAYVPRKPETDNLAASPVNKGAVKQTEAQPESPPKSEVRGQVARPISENNNEIPVVMVPHALPPQNKERRGEPVPASVPAANPSHTTKKKVIPWP